MTTTQTSDEKLLFRFHTINEVAKALSLSTRTVFRMMDDGELQFIRVRNRRRITNLVEFIEAATKEAAKVKRRKG